MANQKLRIVSFNVNGILNPVKRGKILSKMKKEKAQVVYLQETHLNDVEHEKLRKMGFINIFFSSYKSKHKRGVAVLLSNKVTFEQTYVQKDKEGRFILIKGILEGTDITLLNIYAPPGSNISFFKKIFDMIESHSEGVLICGGDLNLHLQPKLDVSNLSRTSKTVSKKFKELMNDIGLIDI